MSSGPDRCGVAFALPNAPGFVAISIIDAAGILGAHGLAAIGGVKTRFHVSEVLSTLMFVYVAMQVLNYLIGGPEDPNGHNFPQTPPWPTRSLPHPPR